MPSTPELPTERAVRHAHSCWPAAFASVGLLLSSAASAQSLREPAGALGNTPAQSNGSITPTATTATNLQATVSQKVIVRARQRLLKEKDSPSAVTELGTRQISQTGVQGSVATLLRAAPSVYVYQSGIGNNEPVLSLRGTRGLETAQTLDDVPMQDLLYGGTGSYLENILGGRFNLDQISGVSIYPGVAYPDRSTFGTIGGTIAYQSLRPSIDPGADLFGSVGSFGTYNEGFAVNTGRLDGALGTGVNAPTVMLKYSNLQTNGYIDDTPARYNNMEFAIDKPYDDGLSKFEGTVLYNTANGLYSFEAVPTPYLDQNGLFSNYPTDQTFDRQTNDYLTLILKDSTYVNDYIGVSLTGFYIHTDSSNLTYGNPDAFTTPGIPGSLSVDGAAPIIANPAGFGQQSQYVPGGLYYAPYVSSYNGTKAYPPGSPGCPASVAAQWASIGQVSPCGYNSLLSESSTDTYGLQPKVTLTPPAVAGIENTIKIGALLAKETSPASQYYIGGLPSVAQTPQNSIYNFAPGADNGNVQRTIYLGYLQDKIDFLHNTFHVTPGLTLEATSSSYQGSDIFGATPTASQAASAYCQAGNPCKYGPFKATKWDRDLLPFVNVSYDLDRILPAARGVSLYASYGESALFAPVNDFGPNLTGGAPYASIVHMYEAGLKYNVSNIVFSADYFYQKVDRDFGFFVYEQGPLNGEEVYSNDGAREFKGVESAITWQATPRWQVFGNISHVLAKYLATSLSYVTVQEDQFGIGLKGTPISGVPDWLSTFGVDYDYHNLAVPRDELNVRFEGQYTGHQSTTYDLEGRENVGPIPGIGAAYGSYVYYSALAGDTTDDPNGGISPFVLFNLDMSYKMPVKGLGPLKTLAFDLNILNLFDNKYFQYFYRQIVPTNCPGVFTSGPFKGNPPSLYSCTPQFGDGIPGEPFAATFTVTAHF